MPEFTPFHAVANTLGYPLRDGDGFDAVDVEAAADACPGVVPRFLRQFYRCAARHQRFTQTPRRFLPPAEWEIDDHQLVFLANSETGEQWGILLGTESYEQPPIAMKVAGEPWRQVSDNLPLFLTFTLHWNAVSGGLDASARGTLGEDRRANIRGWAFGGTVDGVTAYSRRHQAMCVGREGAILAGAKTTQDLQTMARDLHVSLEPSK